MTQLDHAPYWFRLHLNKLAYVFMFLFSINGVAMLPVGDHVRTDHTGMVVFAFLVLSFFCVLCGSLERRGHHVRMGWHRFAGFWMIVAGGFLFLSGDISHVLGRVGLGDWWQGILVLLVAFLLLVVDAAADVEPEVTQR